jgi:hypothetical protein
MKQLESDGRTEYLPPPPGSRLGMVLEGLDVQFALSALKSRPVTGNRRREVIEMRFGLIDGEPKTIREIAESFERSQSVIDQDEIEALITLRGVRDSIRPEKVFQRREIHYIDGAWLYPPHVLRKYGTEERPPIKPEFIYPKDSADASSQDDC